MPAYVAAQVALQEKQATYGGMMGRAPSSKLQGQEGREGGEAAALACAVFL